jgi:hypothetical protein
MANQTFHTTVRHVVPLIFRQVANLTATEVTPLVKFRAPQRMQVERFSAVALTKTGTHVATTLDLLDDGTSVLSALLNFNATAGDSAARVQGTLAAGAASIELGSEVTINYAEAGGTSPVLAEVWIQIDYVPLD